MFWKQGYFLFKKIEQDYLMGVFYISGTRRILIVYIMLSISLQDLHRQGVNYIMGLPSDHKR
jgi:hypothetical protein